VRELLAFLEGRIHRRKRSIEPEAVFGQAKGNKQYNRFRHFNSDSGKAMMDFSLLAIAFNIGKLHNKRKNTSGNGQKAAALSKMSVFIVCSIPQIKKISAPGTFLLRKSPDFVNVSPKNHQRREEQFFSVDT
jgi:hypothetical protein